MKATCLLFLAITYAALPETAYATPSNPASQQTSSQRAANTASDHPRDAERTAPVDGGKRQKVGNPSDEQRDHRVSGKNRPRSPATITKDRPKQVPNNQERSTSGNAVNLHRPGSTQYDRLAKGGLTQQETGNRAMPVRPPSVSRSTAPSPNNVRHRGANPAVIGGSAISDRNTGAINGTRVHRKP